MVQLFKVIVLMSVVLALALVGIVHQVSWSPGQLFLHSHLQIGKKKQVFVNIYRTRVRSLGMLVSNSLTD